MIRLVSMTSFIKPCLGHVVEGLGVHPFIQVMSAFLPVFPEARLL
jgi:hypothetical protein